MLFSEIDPNAAMLPFQLYTLCDHSRQKTIERPAGSAFHQILWVTRGQGVFCVGGEEIPLSVGEGVFTRAHVPHRYGGENGFCSAWCTFSMPCEGLDYIGFGDYLRFRVTPRFLGETEQLLLLANGQSTPLSRSVAGYAYVTEFFAELLSERETPVMRVRRMMEQRFAEPLSLQELGQRVGLDRFALCRAYKRERGLSVMEDLLQIRIKKAKQLLQTGDEPIESVARLCGFESSCYFGKRFREVTGLTPTAYRNRH